MGKPGEAKRKKKKGRPSLLDLQRRSLRLQKQQQQEEQQPTKKAPPKPKSPNPYLRFPDSTPGRRTWRRNPNPNPEVDGEDDADDGDGKRREKKLKLVLGLHQDGGGGDRGSAEPESDPDGSEWNGGSLKKRKIDAIGGDESGWVEKIERHNHGSKATEPQGGASDSGPTTALPDEKLLLFVLDGLQKKDTYGVFSEPVDPEELPDYHEIIEHPMDFDTVRKRLSSGYYANLEMFEKDVFLICSNAMQYNAPDTIYFRQARSIQELAKKNFENLRQESSDDEEPEPKVVRRGRPPSKNVTKKAVGRPPTEHASSDFLSGATLANAGDSTLWSNSSHDLARKGFSFDKPGSVDASARTNLGLHNSESCHWAAEKLDRNEESGSVKGIMMKSGKRVSVLDENRRNTYKRPSSSTCLDESSVLTVFDGEKRQLLPIGIHMEHAFARSLVRFAANLGSVGWDIAAKQIEKSLPPGMKFGRGWVGEPDMTKQCQLPLPSGSPPRPSSQPLNASSTADSVTGRLESPSAGIAVGGHLSQTRAFASSSISSMSSNPVEGAESARLLNCETGFGIPTGSNNAVTVGTPPPKAPFQAHQKMTVQPGINGLSNTAFGFDPSQVGKMARPARPTASLVSDVPMTHSRVLDMVSRGDNSFIHPANVGHVEAGRPKPGKPGAASIIPSPASSHDLRGSWRGFPLPPKPPDSAPTPDLNMRFPSAGSPPPGALVDSQPQPDLALQL